MAGAMEKLLKAHESIVKPEPDQDDDISKMLGNSKPARVSNNEREPGSVRLHLNPVSEALLMHEIGKIRRYKYQKNENCQAHERLP